MDTIETKYKAAILQLQLQGVIVMENYPSCCGSCASAEMSSKGVKEDADTLWFVGSQGRELLWQNGRPFNAEEVDVEEYDEDEDDYTYSEGREVKPAEDVYFNHSGKAAALAVEAFKEAGLTVEWDGTGAKCVILHFTEAK